MKNVTLPSGKKVKFEYGKGYHLLNAQRKAKSPDEIPYALIAELAEFEGKKVPYEDILQFPLYEVSALLKIVDEVYEGKSLTPAQSLSSVQQQTHHSQK